MAGRPPARAPRPVRRTRRASTPSPCMLARVTPFAKRFPRAGAGRRPLLPRHEEAERMARRIEHHPQPARVTRRRLPRRLAPTELDRPCDGLLHVVHLDLEVEHLRELARLLRPDRRLVPLGALDVEVDVAVRVE